MIIVEFLASICTILTIYLFAKDTSYHNRMAIKTGLIGQVFWLWVIIHGALWGLLLADGVIFCIYIKRLAKEFKE